MKFQRDRESRLAFKQWQRRARDWLTASGVQSDLYEQMDVWWYFIEHGNYPGLYTSTSDAALLGSEERQFALVAAILTTPGASTHNVQWVLPPYAFAHLWRPSGVGYALTEKIKGRLASLTQLDVPT